MVTEYLKPDDMKENKRKYRYEKILQGFYGQGWEDLTAYYCDSTGWIKDKVTRQELGDDIKAYRENEPNAHRVIKRRIKL
jgi:hypothetical protein